MAKGRSTPTFGTTLQEVDNSIAQMNAERESIAAKQGTKDFDNKRFEELSNNLEQANIQRAQLSPSDTGTPENTMVEQRTIVPPVQQANIVDPVTTTSIVDVNQPMGSGQPNDLSQLGQPGQPSVMSPDIPADQLPKGNSFMQNFLSSIDRSKNDGIDANINKSIFGQPKGAGGGFKPQPLVDIAANDLFFASNEPILKGMSTGQLTGSRGIYVGGADYFPAQVLNQRKKAIQDAAIAQKQKEQEFLSQRAPLIKDKGFQRNLNDTFNNQFNSMVDQAKETYGENWYDAITDQSTDIGRQFVNFSDNMNFLAGAADQSTDLIATTRNNMDEGKLVYSPETMQMLDDYENMQGQFAGGNVESLVNLREEFGKLQGYIGLDTYLNDKNVDVKATVTGWADVIDNNDSYITSESKKTAYEDQLRQLANGWATGKVPSELTPLVRSGMITEEDIFNHLQSLYGYDAVVTTKSVSNKPAGSGSITINMEQPPFVGETPVLDSEGNDFNFVYKREIPTAGKPMETSGAQYYDKNGNLVREKGVVNINPNTVGVTKFTVKNADGTYSTVYKKGVVGTSIVPAVTDEDGKVIKKEETVTKVYSWDEMYKRFKTDNPTNSDSFDKTNAEMDAEIKRLNQQPSGVDMSGGGSAR